MNSLYKQRAYAKYTWVGNSISGEDMAILYKIKTESRTPITKLVAVAVSEYVKKFAG